jgi:hypothetical protein
LIYRFSLPAPNAGTRVFSFVTFVAEALNKVINNANLKKLICGVILFQALSVLGVLRGLILMITPTCRIAV